MILRADPKRKAEKRKKMRSKKKDDPARFCNTDSKNCLKPPKRWGMCGEHSLEYMDDLWAQRIKRFGYCRLERLHQKFGYAQCRGRMNACHARNRNYFHTRWDLRNGDEGCYGFNYWSELHPIEAEKIWKEHGVPWDQLTEQAMRKDEVDWDAWKAYLKGGEHPYEKISV